MILTVLMGLKDSQHIGPYVDTKLKLMNVNTECYINKQMNKQCTFDCLVPFRMNTRDFAIQTTNSVTGCTYYNTLQQFCQPYSILQHY